MKWFFRLLFFLVILGGIAAGAYWYQQRGKDHAVEYRTARVKRGNLDVTISATGTVEPEEVVNVGAQVAGRIDSFGTDKSGHQIDYGSLVEEGTVLAQIDDSLYRADTAQASATLAAANASYIRATADLEQMKAKLSQMKHEYERATELRAKQLVSGTDYESDKSNYEVANANLGVGKAVIEQAKAQIVQAQAATQKAVRNLDYCTIRSPVQGVIVDRRVNIGQTVVSSLNAPSLFLIAKDLSRMQVWASVNEADIGRISHGQDVTFTVDAFPGEEFYGTVGKTRLNAAMTQNVVTYTVEIDTDNSDLKLLPYLTANVQFHLDRRNDVLQVPNAALRYTPASEVAKSDERQTPAQRPSGGERGGRKSAAAHGTTATQEQGTLWIRTDGRLKRVQVRVGASDGSFTEVSGTGLQDGMEVVLGEQQAQPSAAGGTGSPFTPQFNRGRSGS